MAVYKSKTPTKDGRSFYFRIKYKDIFGHIAYICNILQKANKDITLKTTDNYKEYTDIDNSIKEFGRKIGHNETKKMFDKLKKRHYDFGFKYPENEEKLEKEKNKLWISLLTMAHNLGYINILA